MKCHKKIQTGILISKIRRNPIPLLVIFQIFILFGLKHFKSSLKENENVVPEQLHFVTVLSAICKSAMMNHATIGQIKDGLIGQHGDLAQNHVVVEPESAEEHVKLLITSAAMIGIWFFIIYSFICLFQKTN